jgi:arginine/lysine/ornithine decarboxylase
MLDPIKATVVTPGLDIEGNFGSMGIPASIVTKYLAEHGVIVEKCGLYSFFIMFTIGITKAVGIRLLLSYNSSRITLIKMLLSGRCCQSLLLSIHAMSA